MCSLFDYSGVFIYKASKRKRTFLITVNPYERGCKGMKGFYSNTHTHRHPHTWKQPREPQSSKVGTNGAVTSSSALRLLDSVVSGCRGLTSLQSWGFKLATMT